MEILLSSGCININDVFESIQLITECKKKLPIDGIELMLMKKWYDDDLFNIRELQKTGIPFPVMHIDKLVAKEIFENAGTEPDDIFTENLRIAEFLGCEKAVLHLWRYPGANEQEICKNVQYLGDLKEKAKSFQIDLLVEFIPCDNTEEIENLKKIVKKYPKQRFVLDTKNAAYCGCMDKATMEILFDCIDIAHIHLNDYSGEARDRESVFDYKLPGDGEIDFAVLFQMLQKNRYSGRFTIETPIVDEEGKIDYKRIKAKLIQIQERYNATKNHFTT